MNTENKPNKASRAVLIGLLAVPLIVGIVFKIQESIDSELFLAIVIYLYGCSYVYPYFTGGVMYAGAVFRDPNKNIIARRALLWVGFIAMLLSTKALIQA